jgi:type IV pilus assembly protein PilM
MALFGGPKSAVAVDVGSAYVKVVELNETKDGGFSLQSFGMKKIPPESIVDGALLNSRAIVDAIRELIDAHNIRRRDVVTSVSGHSVIIKMIPLPVMSEEELEEAIQWEAEQYIPFDINDVNIDVQIVDPEPDEAGQMEVMLVAAKKELINDYVAVVQESGMQPAIIDVDVFALQNMFEVNYEPDPDEVNVLINVGAALTNINVVQGDRSLFTRDITLGGNQYTEEIQKGLNVSYEEAEALKLGGGMARDATAVVPEEVESVMQTVSEQLASEAQRSLDFFSATGTGGVFSRVYLAGGSAKVPGLMASIQEKTNLPVELVDPFRKIHVSEREFNVQFLQEVAPMAAVSVGLAMRKPNDR